MRYLSSISLALIVLMALACTAEPAESKPDYDLLMNNAEEAFDRRHSDLDGCETAIRTYDKVIQHYPEKTSPLSSWDGHQRKLWCYGKLGQYLNALELLDGIIEDFSNRYWLEQRGDLYRLLGEHELAIKDYDKAIEKFVIDSPMKGDFHIRRAFAHKELNQMQEAFSDFAEACRLGIMAGSFNDAPDPCDLEAMKSYQESHRLHWP